MADVRSGDFVVAIDGDRGHEWTTNEVTSALKREEGENAVSYTHLDVYKRQGMTGTAMTEDAEFREIYKLPVVAIPPNRPVARKDEDDPVSYTHQMCIRDSPYCLPTLHTWQMILK